MDETMTHSNGFTPIIAGRSVARRCKKWCRGACEVVTFVSANHVTSIDARLELNCYVFKFIDFECLYMYSHLYIYCVFI